MESLPDALKDPSKFPIYCSQPKYKIKNDYIRQLRIFYRTDIIAELEHYRLKPAQSKHFERSAFMQRFPLFKGM